MKSLTALAPSHSSHLTHSKENDRDELVDPRGGKSEAPRHCCHGELPLGSPPWRRPTRPRGDAAPCPPHSTHPSAPARRDRTAAEALLRAHRPCQSAPRVMATPRSTESTARLRTAPPCPSCSTCFTATPTSTTTLFGELYHTLPPPVHTPVLAVRHGEQSTAPKLARHLCFPPDQPTAPAAPPSFQRPPRHLQPDPAPLLPPLRLRAIDGRGRNSAIKTTPHHLFSPHLATTSPSLHSLSSIA